MLAVSAEAKTSAGAPWVICCTSADEASNENVALASGLAFVKAAPMSVNAPVSDAAANTVMSPLTAPAAVVVAPPVVVVAAAVVAVVVADDPLLLSLPQAATPTPMPRSAIERERQETQT